MFTTSDKIYNNLSDSAMSFVKSNLKKYFKYSNYLPFPYLLLHCFITLTRRYIILYWIECNDCVYIFMFDKNKASWRNNNNLLLPTI